MKELKLIETIKKTLSNSSYIGDDCAYLDNLEIVVTQDNLVEGVHFSLNFATPFQIGYKSIVVNISDICASGGVPKYITVGISIPQKIDENWVQEFYQGVDSACNDYDVIVVGGDITSSEKIFISVCAIGSMNGRNAASRKNANVGDLIITSGVHGSSGAGLYMLQRSIKSPENLINAHLLPQAQIGLSKMIAENIKAPCMMDSSDGLMDALFKISSASGVRLCVEFDKIPYDKKIEIFPDFKDLIFYGGEDYQIVACVGQEALVQLVDYTIIGKVKAGDAQVEVDGLVQTDFEKKCFNHWEKK